MPPEVTQIETQDTARVLNQANNEWEKAWLRVYKRHNIVKFLEAATISTSGKKSARFDCSPYHEFIVLLDITQSGVAGNLQIKVLHSYDKSHWFMRSDGAFGSILFGGTAGNKQESLDGKCIAPHMKIEGVSSAGLYTVSATVVFVS